MKLTFSRFVSILSSSWHPFGRLWGHMKALFPLLFSSGFLRGVFMIFRLPGGTPNGHQRQRRTPLWHCGNIAFYSAGGGYYVGFSIFQHLQALCSPSPHSPHNLRNQITKMRLRAHFCDLISGEAEISAPPPLTPGGRRRRRRRRRRKNFPRASKPHPPCTQGYHIP